MENFNNSQDNETKNLSDIPPPPQYMNNYQNQGGGDQLPNETIILVFGILSIALCWCYGLFGLGFGITSLFLGSKSKVLYNENPSYYTRGSYKNVDAGYICAIIGTILSGLVLLGMIMYFAIVGGTLFSLFSMFGR